MPSYDQRNEQIILAAMMRYPDVARSLARTLMPGDWQGKRYRTFFEALRRVVKQGLEVNLDAVEVQIPKEKAGDAPITDLAQIAEAYAPAPANIAYHVERMRLASLKASLAEDGMPRLQELLDDPESKAADMIAALRNLEARVRRRMTDGVESPGAMYTRQLQERESLHTVHTGWDLLDDWYVGGWRPGWVHVLFARPRTGKTVWTVNMAINACARGVRVDVLAWEPTRQGFFDLMMCRLSGTDTREVIGKWDQIDPIKRAQLRATLDPYIEGAAPLLRVFDMPKWPTVKSHWDQNEANLDLIEEQIDSSPADVIVIDRLAQALHPNLRRPQDYAVAMARLTEWKQRYQKHLIPVHHASRAVTDKRRDDARPTLEDLKGAGAWEEDSDTVTALHKPNLYRKLTKEVVESICLKQRYGPMFKVEFESEARIARLSNPRLLDDGHGSKRPERSAEEQERRGNSSNGHAAAMGPDEPGADEDEVPF